MELKTQLSEALTDAISELSTTIFSLVPIVEDYEEGKSQIEKKEVISLIGMASVR